MYIPVSVGLQSIKTLSKIFGKEFAWWKKDALLYWPACLYSAHPNSKYMDFREREEIDDDVVLFCDSGGYQVYSLGVQLDREKVFEWQVRNGNINFCLDKPYPELWGKGVANYNDFQSAMDVTFENAKWYADKIGQYKREGKLRKNSKFVLISQCLSMEQVTVEIDRLYDLLDAFEVVCVAYHSKECWGFISGAMYWHEMLKGVPRDLHFLGMSGDSYLPVLAYLKTIWNGNIYFDSSSMYAGGKYRKYMTADSSLSLMSGGKHRKVTLPCLCPFCSIFRGEEVDLDGRGVGMLLAFHNLYVMINKWLFWEWLAKEDVKEFKKLAKKAGSGDYIEFIDRCLEYGWNRTVKTFWWVGASKVPVTSRGRAVACEKQEEKRDVVYNCFGNYSKVCGKKCPVWEDCKSATVV